MLPGAPVKQSSQDLHISYISHVSTVLTSNYLSSYGKFMTVSKYKRGSFYSKLYIITSDPIRNVTVEWLFDNYALS